MTDDEDIVPVELKPAVIAEACRISPKRALRRLRSVAILLEDGEHRYVVDPRQLQVRLPTWYDAVWRYYDRHARRRPSRSSPPA